MTESEGSPVAADELPPSVTADTGDRRLVTFYSFKGGVGRTMALANVAFRLANKHALRVLVVDWDLEAPGLHRFFGYRDTDLADKPGIVDFFLEWRDRFEKSAESPPEINRWIVPVRAPMPAHGSVHLLTAGKLDKGYGTRLDSLDWRAFYEASAGALAVETLRKQLIDSADVVLVDSRTGLTDAGGICTVQLPDGVVLMTAPNEQSLAGTERVARTIVSSDGKRGGRGMPRVWLSVSRIPLVEETESSHAWLEEHRAWFEEGVASGLWRRKEHLHGLRSHAFPHRPRFALGEQILHDPSRPMQDDPLARAYDDFAALLLAWSRGRLREEAAESRRSSDRFEELQAKVDEASAREDTSSLAIALHALGTELCDVGRYHEAIAHLEQARGIQLVTGSADILKTTFSLAIAWGGQGWPIHALKQYEEANRWSERFGLQSSRAAAILGRGIVHFDQRDSQHAWADFSSALKVFQSESDHHMQGLTWCWMGHLRLRQRRLEEAWSLYERAHTAARSSTFRGDYASLVQSMAIVRREQGRLAEAESLCTEALNRATSGDERGHVLCTLAGVRLRQRQELDAIARFEEAASLLHQVLSSYRKIRCLADLARLRADLYMRGADSLLDEASNIIGRSGWSDRFGDNLFCNSTVARARAYVHRKQSCPSDAILCAREALETLRGLREERYEEALTLAELSQDYAANHQPAEAAAARQEGLAILRELNETFDETELFGPPLPA